MVIFINQLRMKIGVMYGNPETTTGGNALKFYASVRLDIRRTGQIKDRDEIIGNTTRVKVVKNKVAPPFKQVEFDIMYGEGISKIGEILDLGVKAGLVEKSGSWFSYDSIRIGQGRENAKTYLKENPEVCDRLEAAIRSRTDAVAGEMMTGTLTPKTDPQAGVRGDCPALRLSKGARKTGKPVRDLSSGLVPAFRLRGFRGEAGTERGGGIVDRRPHFRAAVKRGDCAVHCLRAVHCLIAPP
jgi:hypothetical protein